MEADQTINVEIKDKVCECSGLKNTLFAEKIDILYFKRRAGKLRRRIWTWLNKITLLYDAESAVQKAKTMMKAKGMMWRFLYDPYNIPMTNCCTTIRIAGARLLYLPIEKRQNRQRNNSKIGLERLMSLYLTWKKNGLKL